VLGPTIHAPTLAVKLVIKQARQGSTVIVTVAWAAHGKSTDEISTVYVVVTEGVATGLGILGSDNPVVGDQT